MGIRFACHICGKKLNIKSELGGKRGVCPNCSSRFRIPEHDCEQSLPVELSPAVDPASVAAIHHAADEEDVLADESLEVDSSGDPISKPNPASSPEPNPSPGTEATSPLLFDGTSTWYVRPPSGGQYGPASEDLFHQWIGEGRVAASALIWRDGWQEWRQAVEVLPQLASGKQPPESAMDSLPKPEIPDLASRPAASILGDPRVGSRKRTRSFRRTFSITFLCLVALVLVGILVWIMNRP
ncbi:hypothetical protein Q31b_29550 [Novipirellula aureliae]|uniref:GYF domain-containing protein n=1 Tax=Novipirellula aureliae TaxID=2527966 RepID=A0A5C6E2A1_9BACT|nr:DUF4339 domain-containing protein [Novipirellula aureliae]TWU41506.1 hypothetical protein Q31b_29550 [Novipirellula aureliae]